MLPVVDDRVAVLAFNDLSSVLGLIKVELVLNKHITAHIFGQFRNVINLHDKINALVDQVRWLIWNEIKIAGVAARAIRIYGHDVQADVAMNFVGRPDQFGSDWVVNQVGERLQLVEAFTN